MKQVHFKLGSERTKRLAKRRRAAGEVEARGAKAGSAAAAWTGCKAGAGQGRGGLGPQVRERRGRSGHGLGGLDLICQGSGRWYFRKMNFSPCKARRETKGKEVK